ncbi:sigma-70 family RNA polymerase sigma factor [Salinicoccus roseus]|uniref:RNA polymerase sigma-70 region 4 domain-containing protein n=1 Tax=Salinicoccus roseus TaxID=45670 RepID=A0A265E3N9_9STAP|nr:sigma-70 family RNA polymerase sigma factor [Salinicoccus roseus]OZT76212.1 hypothetical protein CFN03_12825 [Salinicoccus roseus]
MYATCEYQTPPPYHKLWQSFLREHKNRELLYGYVRRPDEQRKKILEQSFYKFIFERRFISYFAKTIHYTAVQFDRKERRFLDRNQRYLDAPMRGDRPAGEVPFVMPEYGVSAHTLGNHMSSDFLFSAWERLTRKQQQVLDLSFVYGYTDTEIGEMFNQSQQSISRLKQRALQRMRHWYAQKQYE